MPEINSENIKKPNLISRRGSGTFALTSVIKMALKFAVFIDYAINRLINSVRPFVEKIVGQTYIKVTSKEALSTKLNKCLSNKQVFQSDIELGESEDAVDEQYILNQLSESLPVGSKEADKIHYNIQKSVSELGNGIVPKTDTESLELCSYKLSAKKHSVDSISLPEIKWLSEPKNVLSNLLKSLRPIYSSMSELSLSKTLGFISMGEDTTPMFDFLSSIKAASCTSDPLELISKFNDLSKDTEENQTKVRKSVATIHETIINRMRGYINKLNTLNAASDGANYDPAKLQKQASIELDNLQQSLAKELDKMAPKTPQQAEAQKPGWLGWAANKILGSSMSEKIEKKDSTTGETITSSIYDHPVLQMYHEQLSESLLHLENTMKSLKSGKNFEETIIDASSKISIFSRELKVSEEILTDSRIPTHKIGAELVLDHKIAQMFIESKCKIPAGQEFPVILHNKKTSSNTIVEGRNLVALQSFQRKNPDKFSNMFETFKLRNYDLTK